MDNKHNYLITFVNHTRLLQVAVRYNELSNDEQDKLKYWGEPESQQWILDTLPEYISSIGQIVEVKKLFAIL